MSVNFSDPPSGPRGPNGAEEETMQAVHEAAEAGPQAGDPRAAFTAADVTRRFMLGGKAIVTFESQKTGAHFTYQINVKKGTPGPHFVKVLTRPDTYEFLGTIFEGKVYVHGRKSRISDEAKSNAAFMWAWKKLSGGIMPEGMQVFHEGRCARCARRLTVPSSILSGFGEECLAKMEGG